jgi:hypothetical protein
MKPENVTITRKNFEESVSIVVNAQYFIYFLGERPFIFRWIFKKIVGSLVWHTFLDLAESINKHGYHMYDLKNQDGELSIWGLK